MLLRVISVRRCSRIELKVVLKIELSLQLNSPPESIQQFHLSRIEINSNKT